MLSEVPTTTTSCEISCWSETLHNGQLLQQNKGAGKKDLAHKHNDNWKEKELSWAWA